MLAKHLLLSAWNCGICQLFLQENFAPFVRTSLSRKLRLTEHQHKTFIYFSNFDVKNRGLQVKCTQCLQSTPRLVSKRCHPALGLDKLLSNKKIINRQSIHVIRDSSKAKL